MAEDCPTLGINERLLWRKQTLRLHFSASLTDPIETLMPMLNFSPSGYYAGLQALVR